MDATTLHPLPAPLVTRRLRKIAQWAVVCIAAAAALTLVYRAPEARPAPRAVGRVAPDDIALATTLHRALQGELPLTVSAFDRSVREVLRNAPGRRIRIYDGAGIVVYSMQSNEIGRDRWEDPMLRRALKGEAIPKSTETSALVPIVEVGGGVAMVFELGAAAPTAAAATANAPVERSSELALSICTAVIVGLGRAGAQGVIGSHLASLRKGCQAILEKVIPH